MNPGRMKFQGLQHQTQGANVTKICLKQMGKKIMGANWMNNHFKKDVKSRQRLNMKQTLQRAVKQMTKDYRRSKAATQ